MVSESLLAAGDLAEFASRLTGNVEDEYRKLLLPYGLADHAGELAAGRLMRSRLAAITAGEISDALLRRCVALEMLHTSTLIHDDILDNGTVRRDLPTLWMSIGVERAILVGTIMSTRALALARADSVALADEFFETFDRVNSAQLWELQERGRLKDRASHETISTGKSSAPMELALVVGCMSSPLWPLDLTHLRLGIRELGVGFQLFDDVEDFRAWLGDSDRESKMADCDVELGNYTMPVTLLLVESAGARHRAGDPVSVETLRGFSETDWQPSLTATVRIGLEHLKRSERHLAREIERSRSPLSLRVRSFVQWMIESWREKGAERTVRDMPLEVGSMIASAGRASHQTHPR